MKNNYNLKISGFFASLILFLSLQSSAQEIKLVQQVDADTFQQWAKELSNWGRWGEKDEKGTLNLITAEKRIQAAALVKTGKSISLAVSMVKEENMNNGDPLIHELQASEQWAGDTYTINYHGFAHSHLDALCHLAIDGQLYNGFPADGRKPDGAEQLGIEHMKEGIFSRGVLVDIAWSKGLPYLEPGYPIMVEDLEAWEKKAGIKVSSGDILLVRTGRWTRERIEGMWKISEKTSGLHASTAKWLKERGVAVLGSDAGSDVIPSGVEGVFLPIHQLVIHSMGMPILDNLNLEDVATEAQRLNRWEFLFVGAPLRIEGGTGSPLNPIAVF